MTRADLGKVEIVHGNMHGLEKFRFVGIRHDASGEFHLASHLLRTGHVIVFSCALSVTVL